MVRYEVQQVQNTGEVSRDDRAGDCFIMQTVTTENDTVMRFPFAIIKHNPLRSAEDTKRIADKIAATVSAAEFWNAE